MCVTRYLPSTCRAIWTSTPTDTTTAKTNGPCSLRCCRGSAYELYLAEPLFSHKFKIGMVCRYSWCVRSAGECDDEAIRQRHAPHSGLIAARLQPERFI